MMNNRKKLGLGLLVTIALLVVSTGSVFAQGISQDIPPVSPEASSPLGPMNNAWRRQKLMGDSSLHDLILEGVAEATGLTVEEIEERINDGERLYVIAMDAGLSAEDFRTLIEDVREAFFAQAVEDGRMNVERYHWRLEHRKENRERNQPNCPNQGNSGGFTPRFGGGRYGSGPRR